ncbi:MAG TPA: flagellar assembly protein FliW [Solirubrobacterales bacterium]|nr:flagellar assembly protein FliW [Solirubrobacterales bacterium]
MAEIVNSTRFGELQVPEEALVDFPEGMVGVGGRCFALLTREESGAFKWLQETSEADLALPVTDPFPFFPDYEVVLSDEEAERIGITDPSDALVLVVVRADEDPGAVSANLLAPILISAGVGHQVMNEASWAPLREPLLSGGRRPVAA